MNLLEGGLLLVNKPFGVTSHDVVMQLKRLLKIKAVGHAGTLDPMATGLLVVMLGRATKLEPYLIGLDKVYSGSIQFGLSTDTDDVTGSILNQTENMNLTSDEVLKALKSFEGLHEQLPPYYSAIKIDGQPAYKLARKGVKAALKKRAVTAFQLNMLDFNGSFLYFTAWVSSGYYIRSLARDLGEHLKVGGCLASLKREKLASWSIEQAVELDSLKCENDVLAKMIPLHLALPHMTEILVDLQTAKDLTNGKKVAFNNAPIGVKLKAYNPDSGFLAIVELEESLDKSAFEQNNFDQLENENILKVDELEITANGQLSVESNYTNTTYVHEQKQIMDRAFFKNSIQPPRPFLRPLRVIISHK